MDAAVADLSIFGGKAAVAVVAIAGTFKYYFRSRSVTERAHSDMVRDLIQLRKSADEDLRRMSSENAVLFAKRGEDEAALRARIISLEAKLESIERFMPDLVVISRRVEQHIQKARESRTKDLAPGVVRVEEIPQTKKESKK